MSESDDVKRAKRTEKVPANVGAKMRQWREAQDRGLIEVALKIGTVKGHLSNAERGKGNLSLPKFLAFCAEIGVPASRLLEDSILAKDKDFERLAGDLVKSFGAANLSRLAKLTRQESALLMSRGMEAVELERLRKRERSRRRSEGSGAAVSTLPRRR